MTQSLEAAKKDCPVDIPPFDEDGYNEKKEEIERLNARIVENEKDIAVKDVEIKVLTENCERLVNLEAERNGYVRARTITTGFIILPKTKPCSNTLRRNT